MDCSYYDIINSRTINYKNFKDFNKEEVDKVSYRNYKYQRSLHNINLGLNSLI